MPVFCPPRRRCLSGCHSSLQDTSDSFLPCSLVTQLNRACSNTAREQAISGKVLPRKFEWTQDVQRADFPSQSSHPVLRCSHQGQAEKYTGVRSVAKRWKLRLQPKCMWNKCCPGKKNPNPDHAKLVLSSLHTRWIGPTGALHLQLEREERWMVAHNQNRIAVLPSVFAPTGASKVKGWEKRKGPWLQIWFRCILYCFSYECCYWWSDLGF